jgi:hypothetical protein
MAMQQSRLLMVLFELFCVFDVSRGTAPLQPTRLQ